MAASGLQKLGEGVASREFWPNPISWQGGGGGGNKANDKIKTCTNCQEKNHSDWMGQSFGRGGGGGGGGMPHGAATCSNCVLVLTSVYLEWHHKPPPCRIETRQFSPLWTRRHNPTRLCVSKAPGWILRKMKTNSHIWLVHILLSAYSRQDEYRVYREYWKLLISHYFVVA